MHPLKSFDVGSIPQKRKIAAEPKAFTLICLFGRNLRCDISLKTKVVQSIIQLLQKIDNHLHHRRRERFV